MQTVDWGKQHLKKFLSMSSTMESVWKDSLTKVLIHSTKKSIDHPFLGLC